MVVLDLVFSANKAIGTKTKGCRADGWTDAMAWRRAPGGAFHPQQEGHKCCMAACMEESFVPSFSLSKHA